METKETHANGYCGRGRKNKKVIGGILVVAVIGILAIAAIAVAHREFENRTYGSMMNGDYGRQANKANSIYSMPPVSDQFVIPQDAAKSGELAVVVNDLEVAKKGVADVASKESGSIYATFISYTSDNVKNGSIVVQVPAENFDSTFDGLRNIGSQVVQESTQQIPQRDFYPYPIPLSVQEKTVQPDQTVDNAPAQQADQSQPIVAQPIYAQQPSQDKGYIRIVFVDYGRGSYGGQRMMNFGGNILGVGYQGQNMRNNLWVVIAIKSILLIVLIALLVVILRKIFKNLRKEKVAARKPQIRLSERKPVVHVVRQAPKTRSRIVRLAKKK